MAINEKFLQEELAVLQADFDKTKKQKRKQKRLQEQILRRLECILIP